MTKNSSYGKNHDNPQEVNADEPLYSLSDDLMDGDALYTLENEATTSLFDSPAQAVSSDDKAIEEDDDEEDDAIEEDEDEAEIGAANQDAVSKASKSPIGIMMRTLFTPVEGWKSLKRARFSTDEFASRCFYPMIALAALSEGAMLFYEANRKISDWAVEGVMTFITFFFGYFAVLLLGNYVLPRKSRDILKKDIGRQVVMLAMSTLALFYTMARCLPMIDSVLVFLPLWTIYILTRCTKILRVPEEVNSSTAGLLCMLVIGVPIFMNWIFTELMPIAV